MNLAVRRCLWTVNHPILVPVASSWQTTPRSHPPATVPLAGPVRLSHSLPPMPLQLPFEQLVGACMAIFPQLVLVVIRIRRTRKRRKLNGKIDGKWQKWRRTVQNS